MTFIFSSLFSIFLSPNFTLFVSSVIKAIQMMKTLERETMLNKDKLIKLALTGLVSGGLATTVNAAEQKADMKVAKAEKKESCKGKEGCKGKDAKASCKGKEGCKGEKKAHSCKGKDGCKGKAASADVQKAFDEFKKACEAKGMVVVTSESCGAKHDCGGMGINADGKPSTSSCHGKTSCKGSSICKKK